MTREHLVFFGLRPWRELEQYGFQRTSGATFGCLLGSGRFARVTYVHFERRWGTGVRVEPIADRAAAIGLPAGLPLGRFAPLRRASRWLQAALLRRELAGPGGERRLFWLYDWEQIGVAGRLGPGRLLIESLDDPAQVLAGNRSRLGDLPAHRAAALARADLVSAASEPLLEDLGGPGERTVLEPNGVASAFLEAGARSWPEPRELTGRPRPRLVVVAGEWSFERRVDHALLEEAMGLLEGWSLVLVGVPANPGPLLARLLRRPGVIALGARPTLDLVPILGACDVGAVPYREAGGGDALKIREYLACGLPVVTTTIEPPRDLAPWVVRTAGAAAFAGECRRLSGEGLAGQARLRQALEEGTWERRTGRLLSRLDRVSPLPRS